MDIVVTVPKTFTHPCAPGLRGLAAWIAEGDAAGEPWTGTEWVFTVGGYEPIVYVGQRVYVVCEGRLRGYAPLIRVERESRRGLVERESRRCWRLVRGGSAVAVTIPESIRGFRGWRRRWWNRNIEVPFPNWKTARTPGE